MDVQLSKEIEQFRQVVREFVNEVVEPAAAIIEEEDRIPEELVQQAKQLGLLGCPFPRSTAALA